MVALATPQASPSSFVIDALSDLTDAYLLAPPGSVGAAAQNQGLLLIAEDAPGITFLSNGESWNAGGTPSLLMADANALPASLLQPGYTVWISNGLKTGEVSPNGSGVLGVYSGSTAPAGAGFYPAGLAATLVAA